MGRHPRAPGAMALEDPPCQLVLQLEPGAQVSRRLMSALEIAHLKGGTRSSPLTKKVRAKNSPLRREREARVQRRSGSGGSDDYAGLPPPPSQPPRRAAPRCGSERCSHRAPRVWPVTANMPHSSGGNGVRAPSWNLSGSPPPPPCHFLPPRPIITMTLPSHPLTTEKSEKGAIS